MPFSGVSNPVLGYCAFCAVKLVGYSIAGAYLNQAYKRPQRMALVVGGTRTLIGMGAGAAYYAVWRFGIFYLFGDREGVGAAAYLGGLIPVRFGEWWLLLWMFYDRRLEQPGTGWRNVILATMWSFLLDVPAALGFCVTGGISVC